MSFQQTQNELHSLLEVVKAVFDSAGEYFILNSFPPRQKSSEKSHLKLFTNSTKVEGAMEDCNF